MVMQFPQCRAYKCFAIFFVYRNNFRVKNRTTSFVIVSLFWNASSLS